MPIPRRLTTISVWLLFAISCAGNPVAPDALHSPGAPRPGVMPRVQDSVDLFAGTFILTTDAGDTLIGTYDGEASVAIPGHDAALLHMTVTGGTRMFLGATGTLNGKARGVFTGEGGFVLIVAGWLATNDEPSGFALHVPVTGSSAASCAPDGRILLRLNGEGAAGRIGKVTAALSHHVSNTTCFDD